MGETLECNYTINDHEYNMCYYLCDGIYRFWTTFVKTISNPKVNKKYHFAQKQESTKKHVERALGVLQAYFAIIHKLVKYGIPKHYERQ